MSTEPNQLDPQTVRDFARRAILSSAEDVDYCGIGEQFGDEEAWPDGEDAYGAMLDAVYAEQGKATVTVSWPDEQAQDERLVAANAAAARLRVALGYRATNGRESTDFADTDVHAVLASREMWQDMVRKRADDPDADVRAVAALLAADGEDASDADFAVARMALRSRFADRLAALKDRT